jgi:hypothetical protein
MNGLMYLMLDDDGRRVMPLYFDFGGPELRTSREYEKYLTNRRVRHKASRALARKIVAERLGGNDVLHHTPFLDWSE